MPRVKIVYDLENESSGSVPYTRHTSYNRDSNYRPKVQIIREYLNKTEDGDNVDSGGDVSSRRPELINTGSASSVVQPLKESVTPRSIKKGTVEIMDDIVALPPTEYDIPAGFVQLQKRLLETGQLYCDSDFYSTSVFPSSPYRNFEWMRPKDISSDPQFFVSGASRFDIKQGELGDCWLLAAISSLSLSSELFTRVVPSDQDFGTNYCGMFRFRFWQFGEWKDIIIDDRLPTQNGKLVFMHSTEQNEFWSALLEKAYAKINGSYENLKGGTIVEAMEDFTGGLCETFDLHSDNIPNNFFQLLERNQGRCSLMGCSMGADPQQIEVRRPNGLLMGHAYSVTGVGRVNGTELLRIRNPWGGEHEWNGPWSDESTEWNQIDKEERDNLGLVFEDDGEFWMEFGDFMKNFDKLEVCHLGPESLTDATISGKKKRLWQECIEHGSWKRNVNAGGCTNYPATFWTNPQYKIEIVDPDENDEDDFGVVIVGLIQKDMRRKLRGDFHTIGYTIYKIQDSNRGVLNQAFFRFTRACGRSAEFTNAREVSGRHELPPGTYVVIPSTFEADTEAEFLLRILSERPNETSEMDDTNDFSVAGKEVVHLPAEPDDSAREKQKDELKEAFEQFAGGRLGIYSSELQKILNSCMPAQRTPITNFDGFNNETCRSFIALMDVDNTGNMDFDEFFQLWHAIRLWKTIFLEYATENGVMNSYRLREALSHAGYHVSNRVLDILVKRYSDMDTGNIDFNDFALLSGRLRIAYDTFEAKDKNRDGDVNFGQDDFLRMTMYV